MKWRHWAVLIVLLLLNYIIFSTAFTQLAEQRRPGPRPTRTLQPTFESLPPSPMSWIVLPTSTTRPTRPPMTATATFSPTLGTSVPPTATGSIVVSTDTPPATIVTAATAAPTLTPTPKPPSPTPAPGSTVHTVQRGETLSEIAKQYGVSVQAIVEANGLTNPNRIITGQKLTIPPAGTGPAGGQPLPSPTRSPQPANPQAPTSTPRPPATATAAPTATRAPAASQFTASLTWDPVVAPNCSGPGIAKQSMIRDAAGNPVNGVRVEVNCYDNIFVSHPSGNPGEYDPGHYDFSFGQSSPQDWICTARVIEINGQSVTSSEVASIHFDTNDCRPNGSGHQVAILNWTKNW